MGSGNPGHQAQDSAFRGDLSLWGLPMTHDGTAGHLHPFYVLSLDLISPNVWMSLMTSLQMDWVFFGIRRSDDGPADS